MAALPGGEFAQPRDALIALPGIGPYTAAAIAAIAFDRSETVVDGNVERVMARLFAVKTPLPAVKPELYTLAAKLTPEHRAGDYAQAVMDLGATVCTPRNPDCGQCPLKSTCKANFQSRFTLKTLCSPRSITVSQWLFHTVALSNRETVLSFYLQMNVVILSVLN